MAVTRREFLVVSGIVAMTAGCTKSVVGAPVKDPDATAPKETTSEPGGPSSPDEVKLGLVIYAPYAISDGGELSGPVPDVARVVLEKLGIEAKFEIMQWETMMPALQTGAIDIAAGLGINAERCEAVEFSEPDHVSNTAFAVAKGNPKGLKIYADIAAKTARLGVLDGTPEAGDAQEAGVPAESIVKLPDPLALLNAVGAGEIDCFAFDDISLRAMVQEARNDAVEVTDPFMAGDRPPFVGAYAFAKDSDLLEPFNDELRKLHESGEWLEMVEPFGFTKDNEPPSDLTTKDLCSGR